MNEKLEKLNRQKTAAEKKLIAAQHREKQLEHERKRLTIVAQLSRQKSKIFIMN